MKRKLIQVLMVFVLLGQIIAPSIHCIVQASEQLPVYVVKASQKKAIDKAQLSKVLKNSTISDATYTVSEPMALFTMVAGKLVEDVYLPIIVQKKINKAEISNTNNFLTKHLPLRIPVMH